MTEAFICDAIRTPIGRYGGAIAMGHPLGMSGRGWLPPPVTSWYGMAGVMRFARCALGSGKVLP